MSQAWQVGPLVVPFVLVAVAAAVAVGALLGRTMGRRSGVADIDAVLWRMLLVGIVFARLAFAWQWRATYLAAPWSIADVRDGGWDVPAGIVMAFLYGIYAMRRRDAAPKPVIAAIVATTLLWTASAATLAALTRDASPLPAFALTTLAGTPQPLSGYVGKPTIVNLWATWCPPCQREMPVLQKAQAEFVDANVVFVNQGEAPATVARYLAAQGLALDHVLLDAAMQTGATFDQRALPTTLFFDATGKLVSTRIGELSAATLQQRLAKAREASKRLLPH